jgi:hypothetical protein
MIAFLCFLLGVVVTLGALTGWAVYLAVTEPSAAPATDLSHLTQLLAERRLQRLSQDAVTQMLHVARDGGRQP